MVLLGVLLVSSLSWCMGKRGGGGRVRNGVVLVGMLMGIVMDLRD